MKICTKGITRLVIIFNSFVIKVPRIDHGHVNFLYGCLANWKERQFYKKFKNILYLTARDLVIPSLWCSWFGLFQIQKRAQPLDRELTPKEIHKFKDICTDSKKENFGIYEGRVVCVDYGE